MAKHPMPFRTIPSLVFTVLVLSLVLGQGHATCEPHTKIDLLFLIDSSTRVYTSYNKILGYLIRFVSKVDISENAIKIAVVRYADDATVEISFNSYTTKSTLYSMLYGLKPTQGNTRTDLALSAAADLLLTPNYGAREGVAKAAFLITDGDEDSQGSTDHVYLAEQLKHAGVNVNGIAVGPQADQELSSIVSQPVHKHLLRYESYTHLLYDKASTLFRILCSKKIARPVREGCFKDNMKNRTLPHLFHMGRKRGRHNGDGINWNNFTTFVPELITKCLNAAMKSKKEISFFGIQFYGECWGGNSTADYDKYGPGECINSNFQWCKEKDNIPCVGMANSNYVYNIEYENIFL